MSRCFVFLLFVVFSWIVQAEDFTESTEQIYERLDLKKGQVLKIQGEPVNSPQRAMELYQRMKRKKALQIEEPDFADFDPEDDAYSDSEDIEENSEFE